MSYKMSMRLFVLCLVIIAVAVGGCKGKKQAPIVTDLTPSDSSSATGGVETTTGTGLPDIEQEKLVFGKLGSAGTVYFAYDSSELDPTALATLKQNAELIKTIPNALIQIEGHCDERGTQEYNLALGERRALAVRDYLMRLGISGDRMVTITYGEENPADPGHTEAAWAKNRRAEFNRAN